MLKSNNTRHGESCGHAHNRAPRSGRRSLGFSLMLFALLTSARSVSAEVIESTLVHDDRTREYLLHVPSSYEPSTPMPFVLALHGLGQNGRIQMTASGMNEVSEREGFIVAYPSALQGSWAKDTPDINLGFFDDLMATIHENFSVDASQVYATGMSQGAIRSYMLAVERPDVFAAIAPVAGVRPVRANGTIFPAGLPTVPPRPLPMLHVHGTVDSVVPIEGGSGISQFPSVQSVVDDWVANNECNAEPIVSAVHDPNPDDGRSVTRSEYESCATYVRSDGTLQTASVEYYRVNNGGHDWPRQPTLDASAHIWSFFSQHTMPTSALPGDFNGDGTLDATDVDQLTIAMGGTEQKYDLNADGSIDLIDRGLWVTELKRTHPGDANLDGQFDSGDLVQVFTINEYEDGVALNSGWAEGDWNGDREFDSTDFVASFSAGGYRLEAAIGKVASVPEPLGFSLLLVGFAGLAHLRRSVC